MLASNLAALHTDSISRRFIHTGLGADYGNENIPLLLYQDDIVKFDNNLINIQKSNIILETFQHENRMQYHDRKSVIMLSQHFHQPKILLNNQDVPIVEEYRYLGDIVVMNNQLEKLINERKNVITGTIAELVTITAETRRFSIVASAQYLNGIISPKLLLNSETWHPITENDLSSLEKIYSQSLKRLLHIPYSTPTKGLYHELGILSIENQILSRKLNFLHRIINKPDRVLTKRILIEQMKLPFETWIRNIQHHLTNIENELQPTDLVNFTKYQWKNKVKKYIWKKEQEEFDKWANNSSKCRHMKNTPIKLQNYIENLFPRNAKIILEIRLGLLDTKVNYKNKHQDLICRKCNKENETNEHFLNCLTSEKEKNIMAKYQQILKIENMQELKEISNHIIKIVTNNPYFEYKQI